MPSLIRQGRFLASFDTFFNKTRKFVGAFDALFNKTKGVFWSPLTPYLVKRRGFLESFDAFFNFFNKTREFSGVYDAFFDKTWEFSGVF